MKIKFVKYQGLGNDFIVFDGRENDLDYLLTNNNNNLIERLCDRHFGIGADGIILILKSNDKCFIRMRIFNADGTEPEMCGNGIRCLISFLSDNNEIQDSCDISVQTNAGIILTLINSDKNIRVNMGEPIFTPNKIPTKLVVDKSTIPNGIIKVDDHKLKVYAVSMGNPHMIVFVKNVDNIPFLKWGEYLEKDSTFPNHTNVHFVEVIDQSNIKVKVWERGCGPTLACGTGACACLVVTSRLDKTHERAKVHLPGGQLLIEWPNMSGPVYMNGPASAVYKGSIQV